MQSVETASISLPSARVTSKPAAVTNMKNEWLALVRPRPNFTILFGAEEVERGATVLMLDIYQNRSLLAPIEELINRTAASRPLCSGEAPLVYEIIRDRGSSRYVVVEVMGPADFVLRIADGLVELGLRAVEH